MIFSKDADAWTNNPFQPIRAIDKLGHNNKNTNEVFIKREPLT